MIRRIVALCAIVVMLVPLSLMARAQAAPTEIAFWTFVQAHADYWSKSADLWNTANPDRQIKLTPTVYPWADMHDKLLLALQSGVGAPDMVDIEISKWAPFIKGDIHLQDITDLVNSVKDNLVQTRLIYQWQGKQYAVDYHVGTYLMFYNTDVLKAAGVDVDSIKTWDDYIAAGQKVTQGDVWMTALETTGAASALLFMNINGGGVYDKDGNLIIDSPKNAEALQFMADLKLKDKIAEDAPGGGLQAQETYTALVAGKIASLWYPEWYIERFQDLMPQLSGHIVVRPIPTGFGTYLSTEGGGTGTAITDQIDPSKLQLAKDFLKFSKLTHDAGVRIWTTLGFDPMIKDAYTDPELQKPLPYFENEPVLKVIQQEEANLMPVYLGPQYPDAMNILGATTVLNILDNGANPADELKAIKDHLAAMQ
jgi:arabinosaccharide transport system substrate-binding protein